MCFKFNYSHPNFKVCNQTSYGMTCQQLVCDQRVSRGVGSYHMSRPGETGDGVLELD
jgi:hypothetical protein